MKSYKIKAGDKFPAITVPKFGGGVLELGRPENGHDWKLVIVYRGKHCPICTRYLSEINEAIPELNALGIDVAAVSADTLKRAEVQIPQINADFPIGYDLCIEQMESLGLYISHPRSTEESDRPFAEPGLFVINADGAVQVTDISNAPFARPDLKSLLMGLNFIRNPENNYPVRGTYETV